MPYTYNSAEDFNTLQAAGNIRPSGIWSDGTTMWIPDYNTDKIYAYNLATKARDSSKDFNTLSAAGNRDSRGIWSDGTTMWVVDSNDDKIYAYNLATKARDSSKDFNTLNGAGNNRPSGIWSDGTTMWISDTDDDHIFAYNFSSKARDSGKEFNTLSAAGNNFPGGIWSDNTTMWVSDLFDGKLYAYNAATKARDPDKDIDLTADNTNPISIWSNGTTLWAIDSTDEKLYAYDAPEPPPPPVSYFVYNIGENYSLASDNGNPYGIWSDGTTMWVTDGHDDKIYAYNADTKARNAGKDFDTLHAAGNRNPVGIWSDNTTMWVTDEFDDKIYAYNATTKARDATKDFDTLSAAGNNRPGGIWSDNTTMWVVDLSDDKIYAYNLSSKARDSGKDFNTFHDLNTSPTGIVSDGTTMWVCDTTDKKAYAYNLSSKAHDPDKDIYFIDDNRSVRDITYYDDTVWVSVLQTDTLYAYSLPVASFIRDDTNDFDTLMAAGNTHPYGIWSNGSTLWICDEVDDKIYAYNATTKARDSSKDFNTLSAAGNGSPVGIWSDNTTMWVTDITDNKIYAYNLSSKARDAGKDFNTLSALNSAPLGIWGNGTTLWVADSSSESSAFAYNRATKAYDASKRITFDAANSNPGGITSDGTTMWISDSGDDHIYAYHIPTGDRDPYKDFDFGASINPRDIYLHDNALYIADGSAADKVFAYTRNPPILMPTFGTSVVPNQVYRRGTQRTLAALPEATSGNGDITYFLGGAPQGIIFNANTRVPAWASNLGSHADGVHNLTLIATDEDGDTAELTWTWEFVAPLNLPALPARTNEVTNVVSATLPSPTGGAAPYDVAVSNLPEGLSINNVLQVTGTVDNNASSKTVVYAARDAKSSSMTLVADRQESSGFVWSITDKQPALPVIADLNFEDNGAQHTHTFPQAITPGTAPDVYTLTLQDGSALPTGLTFTPATFVFTLAPNVAYQTWNVRYTITDANGDTDFKDLNIDYQQADIQLAVTAIPNIRVQQNVPHVFELSEYINAGNPPYTYVIDTGLLAGQTLITSTGRLSGSVTNVEGNYILTGSIRDLDGDQVNFSFGVEVTTSTVWEMERIREIRLGTLARGATFTDNGVYIVISGGSADPVYTLDPSNNWQPTSRGSIGHNLSYAGPKGLEQVGDNIYVISGHNDWINRVVFNSAGNATGTANTVQLSPSSAEFSGFVHDGNNAYTSRADNETSNYSRLVRFSPTAPIGISNPGSYPSGVNMRAITKHVSGIFGYDNGARKEFFRIDVANPADSVAFAAQLKLNVLCNWEDINPDNNEPVIYTLANEGNSRMGLYRNKTSLLPPPSITSMSITGARDIIAGETVDLVQLIQGVYDGSPTIMWMHDGSGILTPGNNGLTGAYVSSVDDPTEAVTPNTLASVNGNNVTARMLTNPVTRTASTTFNVSAIPLPVATTTLSLVSATVAGVTTSTIPDEIYNDQNMTLVYQNSATVGDSVRTDYGFTGVGIGSFSVSSHTINNPDTVTTTTVIYTPDSTRDTAYVDELDVASVAHGLGVDARDGTVGIGDIPTDNLRVNPRLDIAAIAALGLNDPVSPLASDQRQRMTATPSGVVGDRAIITAEVTIGAGSVSPVAETINDPDSTFSRDFIYTPLLTEVGTVELDFTTVVHGDGVDAEAGTTATVTNGRTFTVQLPDLATPVVTITETSEGEYQGNWPDVPNAESYQVRLETADGSAIINVIGNRNAYVFVPPVGYAGLNLAQLYVPKVRATASAGRVSAYWQGTAFTWPSAQSNTRLITARSGGADIVVPNISVRSGGVDKVVRIVTVRSNNMDINLFSSGSGHIHSVFDDIAAINGALAVRFLGGTIHDFLWDYDRSTLVGLQPDGQYLGGTPGQFTDDSILWLKRFRITPDSGPHNIQVHRGGSTVGFNTLEAAWGDEVTWILINENRDQYIMWQANDTNGAPGSGFIEYRTTNWTLVASRYVGSLSDFINRTEQEECVLALLPNNTFRPSFT